MSLRCTTKKYADLYVRHLDDPGRFLDLASYRPGRDRLLDLCGGTGVISEEAVRRGAKPGDVVLHDLNPRCLYPAVIQQRHDLQEDHPQIEGGSVDVMVCRQSINYIDHLRDVFTWVADNLNPGGRFVFNTFTWPSTTKPYRWMSYVRDGRRFYEAAILICGIVWHVQFCPSIGIDVTKFRHILPQEFAAALNGLFDFDVHGKQHSLYYVCRKV